MHPSIKEAVSRPLNPIQQAERITALDIMRGVVLFGILLMNIVMFGLAGSYFNPNVSGGATGANLYAWIIQQLFFEGTMRALFSLLFGVGTYIMLERLHQRNAGMKAADIYFRRLVWLLFFGLVHGYLLLWTGEILYDYALMGFLLFVFRKMAPKKLVGIAIFLMAAGTVWNIMQYKGEVALEKSATEARQLALTGTELTKEQKDGLGKWEEIEYKMSPDYVAETNKNMRSSFSYLDFSIDCKPNLVEILLLWAFGVAVAQVELSVSSGIQKRMSSRNRDYRVVENHTIKHLIRFPII